MIGGKFMRSEKKAKYGYGGEGRCSIRGKRAKFGR